MTKDFSKIYKVRSCSSMVTKRPTDNVNETVKEMFLFDDILKMKGHPKSVNLKNEKPYTQSERHNTIVSLMGLNTHRQFKFKGHVRTYIGILMEHAGVMKQTVPGENLTKKRYKEWADIFIENRTERFNEKLHECLKPIVFKDDIVKLYKGKGKIIFNKEGNKAFVYIREQKLVSLFPEKMEETGMPIKLGEISERAIEQIKAKPWPIDGYFDVIEERKEVPYKVFCDHKDFKGWKTWRMYSDVERQIRVIINGCRY